MKSRTPHYSPLGIVLAFLASAAVAQAQYVAGQSANYVWGQPSYTAVSVISPVKAGSITQPYAIAVDPTTGKFFIADNANNRVLRYSSAAAMQNGVDAEAYFGQTSFSTKTTGSSSTQMSGPTALLVDSEGNLWVAEAGNNRVTKFASASSLASGAEATVVLGQSAFDVNSASTAQGGMSGPTGLAMDSKGSLYVVDRTNKRILKFLNASSATNGALADGIFGASNFSAVGSGSPTSGTFFPFDARVDSSGNLWVSDLNNNRVLMFSSIATQPTDGSAVASKVLGQSSFVSATASAGAAGLSVPSYLTFDSLGRLYVADTSNNRVLVYENPTSISNGGNASFVLGQTNFTSTASGTTRSSLAAPRGVAFAQNLLFVTDTANNRMLNFAIIPGSPVIGGPTSLTFRSTKKKSFKFHLSNRAGSDSFKLKVTFPSGVKKLATVQFLYAGKDITQQLTAGTYTTSLRSQSQGPLSINVKVTPKSASAAGGKFKFTVKATSVTSSSISSQKQIGGKFAKETSE